MNQPAFAHTHTQSSMQNSIANCSRYHPICLPTAMNHYQEAGGKHAALAIIVIIPKLV